MRQPELPTGQENIPGSVPQITCVMMASSMDNIPPPKPDFYAPPPYEIVTNPTKLPTYEEVQREKHLEGQHIPINIHTPTITVCSL